MIKLKKVLAGFLCAAMTLSIADLPQLAQPVWASETSQGAEDAVFEMTYTKDGARTTGYFNDIADLCSKISRSSDTLDIKLLKDYTIENGTWTSITRSSDFINFADQKMFLIGDNDVVNFDLNGHSLSTGCYLDSNSTYDTSGVIFWLTGGVLNLTNSSEDEGNLEATDDVNTNRSDYEGLIYKASTDSSLSIEEGIQIDRITTGSANVLNQKLLKAGYAMTCDEGDADNDYLFPLYKNTTKKQLNNVKIVSHSSEDHVGYSGLYTKSITDHSGVCKYCGLDMEAEAHEYTYNEEDNDYVCSACGDIHHAHYDKNQDGKCDICEQALSTCVLKDDQGYYYDAYGWAVDYIHSGETVTFTFLKDFDFTGYDSAYLLQKNNVSATFDLNGHSAAMAGKNFLTVSGSSADITIKNGTISNSPTLLDAYSSENNLTVCIDGVTYTGTNNSVAGIRGYISSLTIKGSSCSGNDNAVIALTDCASLDISESTLEGSGTNGVIWLDTGVNSCSYSIHDNSLVKNISDVYSYMQSAVKVTGSGTATLNITGSTLESKNKVDLMILNNKCDVNIAGSTIQTGSLTDSADMAAVQFDVAGNNKLSLVNSTVTAGTNYAVCVDGQELTVKNSELTGELGGLYVKRRAYHSAVKILSGTFSADSDHSTNPGILVETDTERKNDGNCDISDLLGDGAAIYQKADDKKYGTDIDWPEASVNDEGTTWTVTVPAVYVTCASHTAQLKESVKATLTTDGYDSYICSVCGKTLDPVTYSHPTEISLAATSYTYTGKAIKPAVTVLDAKGNTISSSNYTVTYPSNPTNVGTYTAKITFKNHYEGEVTRTYKITQAEEYIFFSYRLTASSSKQYLELGASAKGGKLSYKSSDSKVKISSSGLVTIPANYAGKVTITIKTTNSNYKALTQTVYLKVYPAQEKISSAKSTSKGKMTLAWTKLSYASGYEISYSTDSKFKSAKTVTVTSASTCSKTISKLTGGKKYYVRVRAYKTVGTEKYYGSYSKTVTVTIKK